jgi:hypothetical protein
MPWSERLARSRPAHRHGKPARFRGSGPGVWVSRGERLPEWQWLCSHGLMFRHMNAVGGHSSSLCMASISLDSMTDCGRIPTCGYDTPVSLWHGGSALTRPGAGARSCSRPRPWLQTPSSVAERGGAGAAPADAPHRPADLRSGGHRCSALRWHPPLPRHTPLVPCPVPRSTNVTGGALRERRLRSPLLPLSAPTMHRVTTSGSSPNLLGNAAAWALAERD